MDSLTGVEAQLSPLEASLLSAAKERAEQCLQTARSKAASMIEDFEGRARDRLAKASAEGERAAEKEAARRLVHANREARRLVLEAERLAYERLTTAAVSAALELRHHPKYLELEKRLTETAVELLGPDAEITRDPQGRGGVTARKGSRSVDLTLEALALRCVSEQAGSVSSLWR